MHEVVDRRVGRGAVGVLVLVGLLVGSGQGSAGHSVGHFPSYYPDEIRIEALEPAAAANGLGDHTLHAYVGAAPAFPGPVPQHVEAVRSLRSFLVLSFNTRAPRYGSAEDRCAAARAVLGALRNESAAGLVFHPYPVTPYHPDYLHHLDRAEAARSAVADASAPLPATIAARGRLAKTIVRARWGEAAEQADATLEEVPLDTLLASAAGPFDGGSLSPFVKEGWFQAYRLLARDLDATAREAIDEDYGRLVHGATVGLAQHADVERRLVAALVDGCARMVVGYAPREEYVNLAYPEGIENIAYDSLRGLDSAVFFRTVKLKEYPWNGKLHLAVREPSTDAWNPVAGFTDPMGRLVWGAVGDPALIQVPSNASWMPNRVQPSVTRIEGRSGGIPVPADAILPRPGTGMLEPVGADTFASAKVTYEVLASPFEDGTEMEVADLLYPFVFAYRWGAETTTGPDAHEPLLEAGAAALQERLAALKVLRVERTKHAIAEDLNVIEKTPVLEVYLRHALADEGQTAAMAPPWSAVPWHLLALIEQAVLRGDAAFSEAEAKRRGIAWVDIVRDEALGAKLRDLVSQLERDAYRPEPLKPLVTPEEAQARWRALGAFAGKTGHFLITNGPYRLKEWTRDSVVLEAVREMTYPLGFGTFDRFVNPPQAVIEEVTQEPGGIVVRARAEMVLKMGREYRRVTEPLLRTTMRGTFGLLVASRYVLIGPDGTVRDLDKMQWREDGRFTIALPERLPAGEYTVNLAIFLDGNSMLPSARSLRLRIGRTEELR
jgi:hypothetical protein